MKIDLEKKTHLLPFPCASSGSAFVLHCIAVQEALRCADGVHCADCDAVLASYTHRTPSGDTSAKCPAWEEPSTRGEKALAPTDMTKMCDFRSLTCLALVSVLTWWLEAAWPGSSKMPLTCTFQNKVEKACADGGATKRCS